MPREGRGMFRNLPSVAITDEADASALVLVLAKVLEILSD
jgi:hypothetical protein